MNGAQGRPREIVLASASPRRFGLLSKAGFKVTVIPSGIEEPWPSELPPDLAVMQLALHKARAVARTTVGTVLGADTEVVIDGRALGKPESREHAAEMLRRLSGREHVVYSGVAMVRADAETTGVAEARVRFLALEPKKIEAYLDAAEFLDKAGAYGIQENGGDLVESFDGRLDTVVGLPMDVVERLWRQVSSR
jgi:septum formation protein